jgi:hypothetical protein
MSFGLRPFGISPFGLLQPGSDATTTIVATTAIWAWAGYAASINAKTTIVGALGAWQWVGNAATIVASTRITPDIGIWQWIGNRVTSLNLTAGTGSVNGMVRGIVQVMTKGTNIGRWH